MQIEERYLLYISEVYFPKEGDKTENLPAHTIIKLGSWNWLLARVHMRLSTTCFVGRRLSCPSFKLFFSFLFSWWKLYWSGEREDSTVLQFSQRKWIYSVLRECMEKRICMGEMQVLCKIWQTHICLIFCSLHPPYKNKKILGHRT